MATFAVVNDFLVRYLDSIDEDLLTYLDENEELSVVVVKRMRVTEPSSSATMYWSDGSIPEHRTACVVAGCP